VLIAISLLLISNTHLGYSFGDSMFRTAGIPPWTNNEYNSGLHLSVIAGSLILVVVYIGAVKGTINLFYKEIEHFFEVTGEDVFVKKCAAEVDPLPNYNGLRKLDSKKGAS
jgi:hypothetical protein